MPEDHLGPGDLRLCNTARTGRSPNKDSHKLAAADAVRCLGVATRGCRENLVEVKLTVKRRPGWS